MTITTKDRLSPSQAVMRESNANVATVPIKIFKAWVKIVCCAINKMTFMLEALVDNVGNAIP